MNVLRSGVRRVAWALLAVAVVPCLARADEAEARRAAERDARGLGWLLQNGLRVIAPRRAQQEPGAGGQAEERQEQVVQQAKQMERFFQPMLHSELELIRRCCGGLEPPVRERMLAVGREAVEAAARGFAQRQLAGQLGRESYRRAVEQRAGRRAEAARVAIVARLDRQLDLTAAQRLAITADLEKQWQPEWVWELEGRGQVRINDYPIAPDEAAAAILPHLDTEQAAEWSKWCRAAGSRTMPPRFQWSFDGQGLQQLDGWWGR